MISCVKIVVLRGGGYSSRSRVLLVLVLLRKISLLLIMSSASPIHRRRSCVVLDVIARRMIGTTRGRVSENHLWLLVLLDKLLRCDVAPLANFIAVVVAARTRTTAIHLDVRVVFQVSGNTGVFLSVVPIKEMRENDRKIQHPSMIVERQGQKMHNVEEPPGNALLLVQAIPAHRQCCHLRVGFVAAGDRIRTRVASAEGDDGGTQTVEDTPPPTALPQTRILSGFELLLGPALLPGGDQVRQQGPMRTENQAEEGVGGKDEEPGEVNGQGGAWVKRSTRSTRSS